MYRPEIRKLNSTTFVKNFGTEVKFVTEENGHLWLAFRGKPRAVLIPMRDEAILNEIQGRKFEDVMHKAQVRAARMVRAAWRAEKYLSEVVVDDERSVPPNGMTDADWEKMKQYWYTKKPPVR